MEDIVDAWLAAADPMRSVEVSPLDRAAAERLKEFTMLEPSPTVRRSRRRRIIVGASIVLAGLAIPTVAVAVNGGIHTGIFAGPDETEQVPGQELLDLGDPGIVDVARQEADRVPLPPGDTFDSVIARYPIKEGGFGQRLVVTQGVQFYAQCRWYSYWLNGDATARTDALNVIDQFPDWEFAQHFAKGDSGPQLLRDTIAELHRGDDTLLRQHMAANC